jgi:hypothetical protein
MWMNFAVGRSSAKNGSLVKPSGVFSPTIRTSRAFRDAAISSKTADMNRRSG